MSIDYIHTLEIHNPTAAKEVLPYVFNMFNPKTVIDFGCGNGSWLKVAKDLGAHHILGIDGIKVDSSIRLISESEFLQHNITTPLTIEKRYDLALCLEVVEHLPESAADNIIKLLTLSSNIILFSAAIPGQGGQAHLNEQWPKYWQHKFAQYDFFPVDILRQHFWGNEKIEWWYKQNMLLYVNKTAEEKFKLNISDELPVYIHPELFELKLKILTNSEKIISNMSSIIEKEVNNPKVTATFKRLIKSFVK